MCKLHLFQVSHYHPNWFIPNEYKRYFRLGLLKVAGGVFEGWVGPSLEREGITEFRHFDRGCQMFPSLLVPDAGFVTVP